MISARRATVTPGRRQRRMRRHRRVQRPPRASLTRARRRDALPAASRAQPLRRARVAAGARALAENAENAAGPRRKVVVHERRARFRYKRRAAPRRARAQAIRTPVRPRRTSRRCRTRARILQQRGRPVAVQVALPLRQAVEARAAHANRDGARQGGAKGGIDANGARVVHKGAVDGWRMRTRDGARARHRPRVRPRVCGEAVRAAYVCSPWRWRPTRRARWWRWRTAVSARR